jgi:3',5'-cyclic AMP phosphodiesterase CpdA
MSAPIKIIQVSDIHFGGENVAATDAALERFHAEQPDLLIAAGDLTRDGAAAEFDAAKAWLDHAPRPQLVAPGNHDTPYLGPLEIVERLVSPWKRYEQRFGPADDVAWQGKGASVFAINTARGAQIRWNWSKGAVSSGQTRRLCRRLQASPAGDVKIVVCHHPLIEIVGGPMTARVRGGTHAAETLVQAGADLVLSGHIHTPFVAPYPFGDGKTVAVGSGTLSVRERGMPPSFNIIEIDGADIRVTALAFERTHFEVLRSWAFERRGS